MKIDNNWYNIYFPDFSPYFGVDPENKYDLLSADPFAPDGSLPQFIKDELKNAIDNNLTHYTSQDSISNLSKVLVKKLKDFNNLDVDANTELLITPGSAFGLFLGIRTFINPNMNEEVINFSPSFAENINDVVMMGANNVICPLHKQADYQIDINELESLITKKTKCIVLTNPNNPTGTVQTKDTLTKLAKLIGKHDLYAVVDQCFERNVYDDTEFTTFATLPNMKERTISVFGPSKDLGLSGFRVGYLVAPKSLIPILSIAMSNYVGLTNHFVLPAVAAAYSNPSYVEEWNKIFVRRRNYGHKVLNAVPNVECNLPQSGFCLWVDIRSLNVSSQEIIKYLVDTVGVCVGSGSWFGTLGEGYLRVMFCCYRDDKKYYNAIDLMSSALKKYQGIE